jgi:hypothetical protein
MAQGFYLYGGGGILPVAIVFIIFLCSIVRWSTTIVTFVTIATIVTFVTIATIATFVLRVAQGHYLYGGRGRIIFSVPLVEDTAGGTGVYLYGGRGMSPLPPVCEW